MIDVSRSLGVFDPVKCRDDIHIIGVGATGSHICENLILHGINGSQIHIYDYDKVEEHNISNQLYTYTDISKLKVQALQERLCRDYMESVKPFNVKVDSKTPMSGIVFLLVDSFKARREIFKGLKFQPKVKLIVETRLDARAGQICLFNPSNIEHVKYFDSIIGFDDNDPSGEVSVCGTRQTVSGTVKLLASMATWEFIKWANNTTYYGHEIYFSTDPWFLRQRDIKTAMQES